MEIKYLKIKLQTKIYFNSQQLPKCIKCQSETLNNLPQGSSQTPTYTMQTQTINIFVEQMISERLYKALDLLSPIIYYLGIFSLFWDPISRQFVRPLKIKLICTINLYLPFIWLLFVNVQAFNFHKKRNYDSFNVMVTSTNAYIIGIISFFSVNGQPNNILCTLNANIIYLRRNNRKSIFHEIYLR